MGMPGYVYALINPSIPGLVKVGRTERDPESRAAELSGMTGVATPFIVVFHEYFQDCHAAEDYVHAILEQQGKRTSKNREFFEADICEVIKTIMKACDEIDLRKPKISDELIPASIEGGLSELNLTRTNPANELLYEGIEHRHGLGDSIQDFQEAMRCFTQAAKLGSLDALIYLGEMHECGDGVRKDTDKALGFYKEAVRKGHFVGLGRMACLLDPIHRQNADKLWGLFFSKWAEADEQGTLYASHWHTPFSIAFEFLARDVNTAGRFRFSADMAICVEMVRAHRDNMLTVADIWLRNHPKRGWSTFFQQTVAKSVFDLRQHMFYKSLRDWIVAA